MFNLARIWGIYVLTCLATGRRYVGKCADRKGVGRRWRIHRNELRQGKSGCSRLQNEWTKYGEDAFVWEVLEPINPALPEEHFLAREKHWIALLGAELNVVEPGRSPMAGRKHSSGTRAKMKKTALSKPIEERRAHALRAQAARAGLPPSNLGRAFSEEWRRRLSESHMGKPSPRRRRVEGTCLLTGAVIVYASLTEAATAHGTNPGLIGAVCRGRRRHTGGHTWRYLDD